MKTALSEKIILISGSTDGLGKLVASHLASQDVHLLLHGRNEAKGKAVTDALIRESKNENITYHNGDFSSLEQVDKLANSILNENSRIDILINNAAIGKGKTNKREISREGFELRFAVNYLSQVLLTEKLLPILPQESVIINVASIGQENIDFENIMLEKNYDGYLAYRQSKTALIMYTFDLAERLKDRKIKVNALHPATLMNTKMVMEEWNYTMTSVEEGAEALENLLAIETSGEYYDGKNISKAIPQAYDPEARNALKNITLELLADFLE